MGRRSIYYVDKIQFTNAVADYVQQCKEAKELGKQQPQIPPYIGECFMKICEGIAVKPGFRKFGDTDVFISDALENLVTAINNYNIDARTASGTPNAFGYFSQVAYWCMVRRIKTMKKDTKRRLDYIMNMGPDAFINSGDHGSQAEVQLYIDNLKSAVSEFEGEKVKEANQKHFGWSSPKANRERLEKQDEEE